MKIISFIKNVFMIMWHRHHFIIPPKYWKRYWNSFKRKLSMEIEYYNPLVIKEYNKWLNKRKDDKEKELNYKPLISFIIPVYNIERDFLEDCLNSILNQTYENFEICLADDNSTKKETIDTLEEYEKKDKRVRVVYRKENGHISKATNSALEIATGEYIALMDDDDLLTKDALYKVALAINENKRLEFIYSDEDKLDMKGNFCEPHFKTDFAETSFYGGNYICHFTVIKKSLLDKIGGLRQEFVGAQDFDLFLRATEITKEIYHIPEILYHWRKVPGSTADTIENKEYAIENGKKAVEEALKRKGKDAYVTTPIKSTHYVVHYNVHGSPLVSIILLDNTKSSIKNNIYELMNKNKYNNIEIIVNYDVCIKKYDKSKIKFIKSQNINDLIKESKGQHILIISGKIRIHNSNIIREMLGFSSQEEIGVVGPKIYGFSKLIQSAGLILSNENIYIDAFANYFKDSYGFNGRLIVPYNYSALSDRCYMFSKAKYEEVGGFRNDMNFILSSIDFCLKMIKTKHQNVLLGNISICQKDNNRVERYELPAAECGTLRKNWNLDDNKYYNKNLSKTYCFMLGVDELEKN